MQGGQPVGNVGGKVDCLVLFADHGEGKSEVALVGVWLHLVAVFVDLDVIGALVPPGASCVGVRGDAELAVAFGLG